MNYQELRDAIFAHKPKYSEKYRPLIERISTKGDLSGKGDFSTFGAIYQTFIYAYIIGLRLGEKTPLSNEDGKVEFAPISQWKPASIRDFILITLLNRSEKFENNPYNWLELEKASPEYVNTFIVKIIREMEMYANTGFEYLQNKWDNESVLFASPFVFVNILQALPYNNKEDYEETMI